MLYTFNGVVAIEVVLWCSMVMDVCVLSILQNLCYVALDYKAELLKDTKASYRIGDTWHSLTKVRFQTGEVLFQPRLAGE